MAGSVEVVFVFFFGSPLSMTSIIFTEVVGFLFRFPLFYVRLLGLGKEDVGVPT